MAKYSNKDYIPTYADLENEREEQKQRAEAAAERGFRLGEFELKYTVNGKQFTDKITSTTKNEAIAQLKSQCGMVGWWPMDIEVKTLVEPNIYI